MEIKEEKEEVEGKEGEEKQVEGKEFILNNTFAKLKFYLHCISKVIESDKSELYTNYGHCLFLSKYEKNAILDLVSPFNIKLMLELNLFMVEPDFVPIDKEYQFYDITDDFCKGKINPEVIIEGKTREVLKVIICRQSWINKYYEEPLKDCVNSKGERIKFYDYDENPNMCFCGEKSCDCCCYY